MIILLFLLLNLILLQPATAHGKKLATLDKPKLAHLVAVKVPPNLQWKVGFAVIGRNNKISIRLPTDNPGTWDISFLTKIEDRLKFKVTSYRNYWAGCSSELNAALLANCEIVGEREGVEGIWDCECYNGIKEQKGFRTDLRSYAEIRHKDWQRIPVEGMENEWKTYAIMKVKLGYGMEENCAFELVFNSENQNDYLLLLERENVPPEFRQEMFLSPTTATTTPTTTTTPEPTTPRPTTTEVITKPTRSKWTWPPGLQNSKLFGLFDQITKPTITTPITPEPFTDKEIE